LDALSLAEYALAMTSTAVVCSAFTFTSFSLYIYAKLRLQTLRVSEGPPTWLTLEHLDRPLIRALMTPNNENVVPLEKENLLCWMHPVEAIELLEGIANRENTVEGVESLVEAVDGMSFLD
jgi:hypothetical protein